MYFSGFLAWILGVGLTAESLWRVAKVLRAEQVRLGLRPLDPSILWFLLMGSIAGTLTLLVVAYQIQEALQEVRQGRGRELASTVAPVSG